MLVTKTHNSNSIEITYISYSFNTAKPNPITAVLGYHIWRLFLILTLHLLWKEVTISQANATKMFE